MSRRPDDPARERALSVVRTLRGAGHEALFAGGAVRDRLLRRIPRDYDVATSARPEEVFGLFPHTVPVGERFGVVLVVTGGTRVEVATFRRDLSYADGRRPTGVTYTKDPREDALRRDFTVNGLFEDPETGRILDYVGGRADLGARLVRAIGDPGKRFREDRLRMLRAVRLAALFEFSIEEGTFAAIRRAARELSVVSGERIRDELVLLLTGPAPGRGLGLLLESGLLEVILPEVREMVGVPQPPAFHPEGDVFEHTCRVLDLLEAPSPVLALGALLHDVGKPATCVVKERIRFDGHAALGAEMAIRICRRLRLSRRQAEEVAELVRDHLKFMEVRRMREARLRRFLTGPLAEEHLALHRADCLGSHGDLANWEFCRESRARYLAEPPPPPRLVTGHDLIDLGLAPGPRFAEILNEVEDRFLEGRLPDREAALAYVRSRLSGGGEGEE